MSALATIHPAQLLTRDDIDRQYGAGDGKLKRWLEKAACRGDGPPMVKLNAKAVRYRRADLEQWLDSRTVRSTSEWAAAG